MSIDVPNDTTAGKDADETGDAARAMTRGGVVVLMLIYALSYLDRQIVNILAEPIKNDLGLSDKQLGLLVGLSFAIFYTGFGLPIARLAERMNRSVLIALCLATWSVFTALCGAAGSFAMLLLVRIGVGIGEAGCLPASQALIADYVRPDRKASAMAMLIAGSPLGVLAGMALGGVIASHLGWRMAFLVAALPGLPLALILLTVVKDPLRRTAMGKPPAVPFAVAMRVLLKNRSYVYMVLGAGLGAFGSYAQAGFLASFLLRVHKADVAAHAGTLGAAGFVGLTLGLIWGLGGFIGTIGGGRVADRIGRGTRGQMLVCAASTIVLTPILLGALTTSTLSSTLVLLVPCAILTAGWAGPFYAAVVSGLPAEIRATAAALALLIVNLIGLGTGPIIVGTLSDMFGGMFGVAEGLRMALIATIPVSLAAALLFWLAGVASQRNTASSYQGNGE